MWTSLTTVICRTIVVYGIATCGICYVCRFTLTFIYNL